MQPAETSLSIKQRFHVTCDIEFVSSVSLQGHQLAPQLHTVIQQYSSTSKMPKRQRHCLEHAVRTHSPCPATFYAAYAVQP